MTTLALAAVLAERVAAAEPDKWQPYLEFHADLATDQGKGGGGEIFVPLWQDQHSLLYGDFRGQVDSQNDQHGGSATGIGSPADDGWVPRAARPRH